jgi:hypothetical protein
LLRKNNRVTFVFTFKIPENMFEFSQYLGFTFFNHPYNGVLVNVFLVGFVSYWVGGTAEAIKRKEKKKEEQSV